MNEECCEYKFTIKNSKVISASYDSGWGGPLTASEQSFYADSISYLNTGTGANKFWTAYQNSVDSVPGYSVVLDEDTIVINRQRSSVP